LIDYFDVWGNKSDGFHINNFAIVKSDLMIMDQFTNKDIINELKKIGYLNKRVKLNMFDIDNYGDVIELSKKTTGEPICRIQKIS
jgi:hypothetical protein